MDNLTLIDLRKILQNHNKTLKKKMFKLTGGRAKLLEIVKKNFKVRSKTDKVINIIHKGKQSSYILNLAGTTKRVAEDKKFKDKKDAKKIKAVQNKKKREAKKEEERVIIKAKVLKDILLKEMKKKVKNPKKIKVMKNKLTALERQSKMLKSNTTKKLTNKIKIMPKLAKINPKTKESLKKKKEVVKFIKKNVYTGMKKKLDISRKTGGYNDITWTFKDKNIKNIELSRDNGQLRLDMFYKNKGAERGIATKYLKQILRQLISKGDIDENETIEGTMPLMNALDDGKGKVNEIDYFDDYRPLPPKIKKKIETKGRITLADFKQIINGLFKNYSKLGFKLDLPLSKIFKEQIEAISLTGKVSDILK